MRNTEMNQTRVLLQDFCNIVQGLQIGSLYLPLLPSSSSRSISSFYLLNISLPPYYHNLESGHNYYILIFLSTGATCYLVSIWGLWNSFSTIQSELLYNKYNLIFSLLKAFRWLTGKIPNFSAGIQVSYHLPFPTSSTEFHTAWNSSRVHLSLAVWITCLFIIHCLWFPHPLPKVFWLVGHGSWTHSWKWGWGVGFYLT